MAKKANTTDVSECSAVVKSNGSSGTLLHGDPWQIDLYNHKAEPAKQEANFKRVITEDAQKLKRGGSVKSLVVGGFSNYDSKKLCKLFVETLRINGLEPSIIWGQAKHKLGRNTVAVIMDASNDAVHLSVKDPLEADIEMTSLSKVVSFFDELNIQPGAAIKIKTSEGRTRLHSHEEANNAFQHLNQS